MDRPQSLARLVALGALLAPSCSYSPPVVPPELQVLPHRVEPELRRLEEAMQLRWTEWEPWSRDPAPELRASAWRALARRGQVFDAEGQDAELVARARAEVDPRVQIECAFALPRCGVQHAQEWLLEALSHRDGRVRAGAARGLAHLGGPVVPWGQLLNMLEKDPHPLARADAATALLAWIGVRTTTRPELPTLLRERIVALLLRNSNDPEQLPFVRWRCAHALAEMSEPWPDTVVVVGAYGWTRDEIDLVRFQAARLYARLLQHPAAVEALWILAQDKDPRTATIAAQALQGKLQGRNFRPFRRSLEWGLSRLEGRAWDRPRRAAYAALLADDPQSRHVLRLALEKESSSTVRAAAFRALHRIDPDGMTPERDAFAAAPDWVLREAATLALADLPGDELLRAGLAARRQDAHPLVRQAALRVLFSQRERLGEGFRSELRRVLREGDLGEVGVAVEELQKAREALGAASLDELRDELAAARGRFEGLDGLELDVLIATLLGEPAPDHSEVPFTAVNTSAFDIEPRRRITLVTNKGELRIELFGREAPRASANFLHLVETGALNGLSIHRVVNGFVVQGLDPRGDGWGSGGVRLPNEIAPEIYGAGVLGVPDAGLDTGGSQAFFALHPWPHLDGRYTRFARIVEGGSEVLMELERGDVLLEARVEDWPAPPQTGG